MLKPYEALNNLREVSAEITRLNKALGRPAFNPAALDALREVMTDLQFEAGLDEEERSESAA